MNRSAVHDTFSFERHFSAEPARVFAAFAEPPAKQQPSDGPPGIEPEYDSFDFREGGKEANRTFAAGRWWGYTAVYHDIVPNERIIYSYEMDMDGRRTSVSVATIELHAAADGGTDLTLTEHGVYLDGFDEPEDRRASSESMLAALTAYLTA